MAIADFLYDDRTGFPPSYQAGEVDLRAPAVFAHILSRAQVDIYAR